MRTLDNGMSLRINLISGKYPLACKILLCIITHISSIFQFSVTLIILRLFSARSFWRPTMSSQFLLWILSFLKLESRIVPDGTSRGQPLPPSGPVQFELNLHSICYSSRKNSLLTLSRTRLVWGPYLLGVPGGQWRGEEERKKKIIYIIPCAGIQNEGKTISVYTDSFNA